jgi:Gram-negative bacterial TonB protein C-terminal
MKIISHRVILSALLVALPATAARAQQAAKTLNDWVTVEPPGEAFVVSMPNQPTVSERPVELGGKAAVARLYKSVGDDSTTYRVWSFEDPRPPAPRAFRFSAHFDEFGELAWNLLVGKKWKDPGYAPLRPPMAYARELYVSDFGREYRLNSEKTQGTVDIYAVGSRVYVVAAETASSFDLPLEPFLNSFGVRRAGAGGAETLRLRRGGTPPSPVELTRAANLPDGWLGGTVNAGGERKEGVGPAAPAAADSRPFSAREVTRKAVITYKPEPGFTKPARKFAVGGLVKLRVLLSSGGKTGPFQIVSGLPHGLTESALQAARQIRFEPAEKDGRKVSQWIIIEYNFG